MKDRKDKNGLVAALALVAVVLIAIAVTFAELISLGKTYGTVIAAGRNNYGQCDVGDWTDIRR